MNCLTWYGNNGAWFAAKDRQTKPVISNQERVVAQIPRKISSRCAMSITSNSIPSELNPLSQNMDCLLVSNPDIQEERT